MLAIVTAVHEDGSRAGWPGEPVYRYLGEDGSWAWVPQPHNKFAVGSIIKVPDGWEWLDATERKAKLAALKRRTYASRVTALRQEGAKEHHATKKTSRQLDREITQWIGQRKL